MGEIARQAGCFRLSNQAAPLKAVGISDATSGIREFPPEQSGGPIEGAKVGGVRGGEESGFRLSNQAAPLKDPCHPVRTE